MGGARGAGEERQQLNEEKIAPSASVCSLAGDRCWLSSRGIVESNLMKVRLTKHKIHRFVLQQSDSKSPENSLDHSGSYYFSLFFVPAWLTPYTALLLLVSLRSVVGRSMMLLLPVIRSTVNNTGLQSVARSPARELSNKRKK